MERDSVMNLSNLLTQTARRFPGKTAIIHGPKTITYAEFNSRANRLANSLQNLGIKQGDNVAILQFNCPEFYETLFACFKCGCGTIRSAVAWTWRRSRESRLHRYPVPP